MSYQLAKFQFFRLSLTSFIDRFRKHNDDVIMTSFDFVGILNYRFLKLYIDYHLSKFQIFWPSGSNFMKVSVRYHIFPSFFVMTSFIIVKLSNLHIL